MKMFIVVAACDGTPNDRGEAYAPGCFDLPTNEVGVSLEGTRTLQDMVGKAKLSYRDNFVVAEMSLLNTRIQKEQLDILYPFPIGALVVQEGKVVKKAIVTALGLSIHKPADPRILTVGRQMDITKS
jgi:hypothetical protein